MKWLKALHTQRAMRIHNSPDYPSRKYYKGMHRQCGEVHLFRVKLTFSKGQFERHIRSILPDITENVGRSKTTVEEDAGNFYIYIEAPDTVSLRASVGSLTRWLAIVDKVFEEVE